jgi:hypothetical protein
MQNSMNTSEPTMIAQEPVEHAQTIIATSGSTNTITPQSTRVAFAA